MMLPYLIRRAVKQWWPVLPWIVFTHPDRVFRHNKRPPSCESCGDTTTNIRMIRKTFVTGSPCGRPRRAGRNFITARHFRRRIEGAIFGGVCRENGDFRSLRPIERPQDAFEMA